MNWFDEDVLDIAMVDESMTPMLDKYTENLSQKIERDPESYQVFGRDKEIAATEISLLRRSKNSPLLVGDAGVGKTAIVEGLAVRIYEGNVDPTLQGLTVRSLELSNLMDESDGGFIVKFKRIIEEMAMTRGENLLFIDEIHTIVGTGGDGSYLDAGNVIKPVLARGEIQIIGATTLDEYHVTIEKDKALERRFQTIMVDEPSVAQAIDILSRARRRFEAFHGVRIDDSAVEQAVRLSVRYIPERYLPDKAFDLIDEATTVGRKNDLPVITEVEVAQVLRERTGIPVSTILKEDTDRLLDIKAKLSERVKGQNNAVSTVADAVAISKAGMEDEDKPASFLFLGTTGVGKTELAKALAELLFDDENAMIRLDMSEYMQKGDGKRLIGDGQQLGVLTERVKRKPYSVVLIDEIEKADRSAHDLLLQVLDDGRLTDANGRLISFKNTIVIMTTNIGAEKIKNTVDLKGDIDQLTDREYLQFIEGMDIELQTEFRPEFINRIGYKIVFQMLDKPVIKDIAVKNLYVVSKRLQRQGYSLEYSESLLDYLADAGTDVHNGARPLGRLIERKIIAPISWELLKKSPGESNHVKIVVEGQAPGEFELLEKRTLRFEFEKK